MHNIYRRRRTAAIPEGKLNLSNLRRSVNWATGRNNTQQHAESLPRATGPAAIQERLAEILVLELRKDGGRKYLTVTGRSLYRHVLQAITHRENDNDDEHDEKGGTRSKKSGRHLGEDVVPNTPRPDLMSAAVSHEISETEMRRATSTTTPETGGASEAIDSTRIVDEAVTSPGQAVVMEVEEGKDDKKGDKVVFEELVKQRPPKISRFESVSTLPEPIKVAKEPMDANQHPPRKQPISYRERLGGHLHPRDMRRLFTPFSPSNEPELIVRRHVMLLNFDPLRAIILRDRLIVLVPDGADSMLVYLEERAQGGQVAMERAFFGSSAETPSIHDTNQDASSGANGYTDSSMSSKKPGFLGKLSHQASKLVGSHNNNNNNYSDQVLNSREGSEASLMDKNDSDDDDVNHEEDEWAELEGKEWSELPFELSCTDAVLYTVTNFLAEETSELHEATLHYIQRILKNNTGLSDDPLTIIRIVKDSIREMTSRVKGFVQSLNRILDEDEDMALMNLSRLLTHPERFIQPVSPEILEEESDEPEIILESHLQQALTLINALDLIKGQVDSAAELIDQKLDATRNKILLANMLISTITLCLSVGTLVGGFMGMNVTNHIEDDPDAFAQITYGTLTGCACLFGFILSILYYSGTIAPSAAADNMEL